MAEMNCQSAITRIGFFSKFMFRCVYFAKKIFNLFGSFLLCSYCDVTSANELQFQLLCAHYCKTVLTSEKRQKISLSC